MTTPTDYTDAIAKAFVDDMKDKLDQELIDEVVQSLKAPASKYFAEAKISGYIFYGEIEIREQEAPKWIFNGQFGGAVGIGAGGMGGGISTADLDRLTANTHSFWIMATPLWVAVMFFDRKSRFLGTYQAFAFSTVNGISAGGTGKWR